MIMSMISYEIEYHVSVMMLCWLMFNVKCHEDIYHVYVGVYQL